MRTLIFAPILASASILALTLLAPSFAFADEPIRSSQANASFPTSDRQAAKREAQRSNNRNANRQVTQKTPAISNKPAPHNRDSVRNGHNRGNAHNRGNRRDHNSRNRHNSRDHNSRNRYNSRDHNSRNRDHRRNFARGHRNRYNQRHIHNRHRNRSNFSLRIGNLGHNNYGRSSLYASGFSYSFFGGDHFRSSYNLYPWWYGTRDFGYRTRSGYHNGYGHIGHSNVYCDDSRHRSYGPAWNNTAYGNQYFSTYSDQTNGTYGGYSINSCHLENKRGTFNSRRASVRATVCWDEQAQRFTETGAVQLISYH